MMAGLARIGYFGVLHGVFREQRDKYMGVGVARFGALDNPWHMATHTVPEGVDGMGRFAVNNFVAGLALF